MSGQESEYVVGWGTLALINANLAQLRRRSPVAWFLASLLGGPVVTLALLLTHVEPSGSGPDEAPRPAG